MDDVRNVIDKIVIGSGSYRVTIVGPFDEDAFDRYAA